MSGSPATARPRATGLGRHGSLPRDEGSSRRSMSAPRCKGRLAIEAAPNAKAARSLPRVVRAKLMETTRPARYGWVSQSLPARTIGHARIGTLPGDARASRQHALWIALTSLARTHRTASKSSIATVSIAPRKRSTQTQKHGFN